MNATTNPDDFLSHDDCIRNMEACRESGRSALKHAERHRLMGHDLAMREWTDAADTYALGARYWREKAAKCDPVGNPMECVMR